MPKNTCENCGETLNDIDAVCQKCKTPPVKEVNTAVEKKKPKMKIWKIIVAAALLALTAFIVKSVYRGDGGMHFGKAGAETASVTESVTREVNFEQTLLDTAEAMNKTLPRAIDRETVLSAVAALPGKKFYYQYALINFDKEQIDARDFTEKMGPHLLEGIKTNPNMQNFRDNDVILIYAYTDRNGNEIALMEFGPKDYK